LQDAFWKNMNLTNKRALITGGTKGIGAAIALDLARHGCDVAVNGRNDDEFAKEVTRAIRGAGRQCAMIVADVGHHDQADRCVDEACAALGGLDILVHSAGVPSWGNIDQCEPHQWMCTFDVHVHAAYFLCRRALPTLRQAGEAAIVLVSSVAGIRGISKAIAYATAKAAIVNFTRCLALDEAEYNVRVNCVAPGVIRTRFHDDMTPEKRAHNLAVRIPLHREGSAEQVADVVRIMITNDFITGELFVVDGGTSMQVCR
jgi:NAD(P)-dependent dehydrogenase (short-subunit alcohol dehydrogenase family)